jgi:hypothetical protein
MGRLMRRVAAATAVAVLLAASIAGAVSAFSGFGTIKASATYNDAMTFSVALPGGAPQALDLLLQFTGSDETLVIPVEPGVSSATYRWDAAASPVTPNTAITYRWRATDGGQVTLSPKGSLLYDDDRPGLDWHMAHFGDTTVHWYGGAETVARQFGALSATAARAAEQLLDHNLAGPIDIFVYDTRDEFFGALGPGAREWTGAATFPPIRTIFMWLGGGSSAYLQTTLVHEVTHVVFHDATDNAYHDPPRWFNEGLASWAEEHSDASRRSTVEAAASGAGLLALDGLADAFPIDTSAALLAYAEGTSMVQLIIDRYGEPAIARLAAAWRGGATDEEALRAGTGVTKDVLYSQYFALFGVDPPQPVSPAPILASNVDRPPQLGSSSEPAPTGAGAAPSGAPVSGDGTDFTPLALLGLVVVVLIGGTWLAVWSTRRVRPE